AQRPEATPCNDTETPIDQAIQHNETPPEANSSVTKQHGATLQNETSLFGRFGRGLKAFLK
ncbi:MAG: DNA-binding protein, partial [Acinetobacter sp.]